MYYPMYFDPTYILVLIGVVICLIASAKMNSTFSRYSRVRNHSGMTGRDALQSRSFTGKDCMMCGSSIFPAISLTIMIQEQRR